MDCHDWRWLHLAAGGSDFVFFASSMSPVNRLSSGFWFFRLGDGLFRGKRVDRSA
jgi:hypothetical protein